MLVKVQVLNINIRPDVTNLNNQGKNSQTSCAIYLKKIHTVSHQGEKQLK